MTMQVPQELRESRYGVRTFQNPELLKELNEIAPEYRLLELMDQCLFCRLAEDQPTKIKTSSSEIRSWQGSATELEFLLRGPSYGLRDQANKLLYCSNTCGTYLARLADKEPNRVKAATINGARRYTIYPPPGSAPSNAEPLARRRTTRPDGN
jgi:hypothetical protein